MASSLGDFFCPKPKTPSEKENHHDLAHPNHHRRRTTHQTRSTIGTRHGTGSVPQGGNRSGNGFRAVHDLDTEQKTVTFYQHPYPPDLLSAGIFLPEKEITMNEIFIELLTHLSADQRMDFEERAGIMEYDGGLTRDHAECLALLCIIRNTVREKENLIRERT